MEELNAIAAFAALSQPTRLAVFRALVRAGPDGVAAGALAELVAVPASTLSSHLKLLEHAGLVTSRRLSRHIFYAARFDTARALIEFLMEDCCAGHPAICGPVPAVQAACA
ncbi:winged helix-turn-helix domain-containing protein [Sandarakinorhabdus sp.]|uniref:ArsR/SmtB family transcription factor n=1 Tax=Sandarakinorhabdus sp. TaxID=1916663 RepID=UPI00333F08C9